MFTFAADTMDNKKEITIYDLADTLGLSPATISRALNGNPLVKEKTRKKIATTAEQLGYRMNSFAQNIRTGKTKTIGVIVHELRSNFITSVLAGIEKVASSNGYDIIIGHSAENANKEVQNTRNLFNKRVDGLLASLAFDTLDFAHYKIFTDKGIPVVFYDRSFVRAPFPSVVLDNYRAGYDMTEHLIAQGCKRIMHVTADISKNVYLDRLEGYKAAMEEHKLPIPKDFVQVTTLNEAAGVELADTVLRMKAKPEAIFVTNDFCAAVIMNRLLENGVRIPEDIAFAGFNDDSIAKIIRPRLTTIYYPGQQMGEIAAQRLINELKDNKNAALESQIVMRPQLVVRESSLKLKK
ncbi:MAG: LacI family DNA-binding transcriptional regulator [Chitinophagaceae bacterium]